MKLLKSDLFDRISNSLFIISLISFFWFLIRTGENPSRAVYPCQRAALLQFSTYAICILPVLGLKKFMHFFKCWLSWRAVFKSLILSLIFVPLMISFPYLPGGKGTFSTKKKIGTNIKHGALGVSDITNILTPPASAQSIGTRVVSVHDSNASNWDHATGRHWEYIDQGIVNNMFAVGLMALTGRTNTIDAWRNIIPYQPGDKVAIKFNFNNSPSCGAGDDNELDGLSETANAIISGLISIGVPSNNIWIYDAMRRVIPTRFISRVNNKNVRFFGASPDGACASNYYQTLFVDPTSPDVSRFTCQRGNLAQDVIRPARVLVDAQHLINVPIFRSHGGMASFALKNHYGSVFYNLNDQNSMHSYFDPLNNQWGCDLNTANILADINNNPHIKNKTRLIIGEGIFGHSWKNWGDPPIRYVTFNNDDPNIYFFGFDPIAVSSVMADSLNYERSMSPIPEAHWPNPVENHEQLHAGALLGLGIHEHWDNPVNRRYSSIDYIRIDLDTQTPAPEIAVTDSVAPTSDLQIAFGSITVGNTSNETVTITNHGNANLSIGSIGQTNPLSGPFSIVNDICSGQSISPAASCTLTVRFSPLAAGSYSDSFDVPSNDSDESSVTVNVSGSGLSSVTNNPPSVPQLIYPANGQRDLGTTVTFRWGKSTDPDGNSITYDLYTCEDQNLGINCLNRMGIAFYTSRDANFAGLGGYGSGMLLFGIALLGSTSKKRRNVLFFLTIMLIAILSLSCGGGGGSSGGGGEPPSNNEITYSASGLKSGVTYYWSVVAKDGNGGQTQSEVRNFTTR